MDIKYIGHSSFFIRTRDAKIITDPFDPSYVGLKYPKQEADIVTISHAHEDHAYKEGVKGESIVFFDWPGEFEKNKVRLYGYSVKHDNADGKERGENIMYKIVAEGISILHCGDLGHLLNDATIEKIGDIDILMIPVGGHYTIGPKEAEKIIKEIEPAIVIPMHYKAPGMNEKIFGELQTLEEYLKQMGLQDVEPIEKLSVKKEDLTSEETKTVVLKN